MFLAAAFVAAVLTAPPPRAPFTQNNSQCLHVAGQESEEQRQRRVAALTATRAINSAQAAYSAKNNRSYATREQLAAWVDANGANLAEGADVVPGFTLTFDTTPKGYWFEIADTTDPCAFRFISNQRGLIFTAQPIR
jgi:hypothetical protein